MSNCTIKKIPIMPTSDITPTAKNIETLTTESLLQWFSVAYPKMDESYYHRYVDTTRCSCCDTPLKTHRNADVDSSGTHLIGVLCNQCHACVTQMRTRNTIQQLQDYLAL